MLENRSFDHILGFSGLKGVDIEGNPTTLNGSDPARDFNIDPRNGNAVPVSVPADLQLAGIDKDPGHEFADTLMALCGSGHNYVPALGGYPNIDNSGFIENYFSHASLTPERIMQCFRPNQLPVIHALASEFAVCDAWFSSMPGPTWPNRFFLMGATSGGLDDSPSPLDIATGVALDGYTFENGNVFDLLDEHCLEWRIYHGDEFPVSLALNGMNLNYLQKRFKDLDDFETELNKYSFDDRFVFIEPKYGRHKFDITGPGDATCGNSMHPLDDVTRGEALIKRVYEAIRNSPHWEQSALLIVFDENGGFYDHEKPPPATPPGDVMTLGYIKNSFQFDQLGPRVPAIVISPYTASNVIDHTIYDHSSLAATLERLFGMHHLTNRDADAKDFLHLFSLPKPRPTPSVLPDPAVNPNPLDCFDWTETLDGLLIRRSQLKLALRQDAGLDLREFAIPPSQVGFLQIALNRVLQDAGYEERQRWLDQYRSIRHGIEAEIFMADAKLKLKHRVVLPHGPLEGRRELAR